MENSQNRGDVLVVAAGICWGMIGIFTRFLSTMSLDSFQITWARNLVAAAGMLIVILATDKRKLCFEPKDIWMFLGTGILSIVLFNVCYFKTIEMTTMAVAAVLLYTAPAMVVIMSFIFFKEPLTRQKVIALVLALAGCVLTTGLIGSKASITPAGLLTGIGSGFGYALYSIFGNVALKKYHPFTVTFYTFLLAAAGLTPFSNAAYAGKIVLTNSGGLLCAILLGIMSTLIPFLCYTEGLKCMEAGKASVMAFVEPLVATVCGIVIFHERITAQNMAGIILIFVSMILLNK